MSGIITDKAARRNLVATDCNCFLAFYVGRYCTYCQKLCSAVISSFINNQKERFVLRSIEIPWSIFPKTKTYISMENIQSSGYFTFPTFINYIKIVSLILEVIHEFHFTI